MKSKILKYLPAFVVLILFYQNTNAQSFTITPNDTLTAEATPDQLTIFDIYMDNTQSDTIMLSWERVSLDIPAEWDYSLCDLGTCYPGVPDGATMYPVPPGSQGFLGYNVIPSLVSGTTTLVMNVWETSNPDDIETIVWIINSDLGTDITTASENAISIYPTIAHDVINIAWSLQQEMWFSIYDISGRIIAQQSLTDKFNSVDVSAISEGIYFTSITDRTSILKTQKIIIQ